jgi:arsenate reductase (thioredoxin)
LQLIRRQFIAIIECRVAEWMDMKSQTLQKKLVLVLCTGNSCRSQMAEAIINHLMPTWQAFSAGTKPVGFVHPLAIRVLQEIGIEHAGHSKTTDTFRDIQFDLVITVCDDAAEDCPVWLGKGRKMHMSFPDPAKASGSEEEILQAFRTVRDDISSQIPNAILLWEVENS